MTIYQEWKNRLVNAGINTKYFNKAFLTTYLNAYSTISRNIKNGVEDRTEWNGITVYTAYIPVYETDFYNKNGGAYCRFLELISNLEVNA